MSKLAIFDSVGKAFAGAQRKATIALLVSPVLMLTWSYFGSQAFYLERFHERFHAAFSLGGDPRTAAAAYSFVAAFFLLGIIPAMIVKFVFHERLREYGVQLGDRARTFRSMAMLAPLFVLGAYVASHDPGIARQYPLNPNAGASAGAFAFHVATYALFYLGWEFHFRGFLQFGLRGVMGEANALLVQVMASCLLHIGKPASETYGSILGGILWGLLAYRTRSLLSGMIQHFLLGVSLEWFLLFG